MKGFNGQGLAKRGVLMVLEPPPPLTSRSFTVSIFRAISLRYLLLTKQLLVIWNPPPPPIPLLKMLATFLTVTILQY